MYTKQRLYLNVGTILLVLAIMFVTPAILVSVYDSFRVKVSGNAGGNQNMRSFVWSVVTVSALSALTMLVYDVFTIYYNITLYPPKPGQTGYNVIFVYFIAFAVLLGLIIIGDLFFIGLGLYYIQPFRENAFPIPGLFIFVKGIPSKLRRRCSQPNQQGADGREALGEQPPSRFCSCECFVLLFGGAFFTLFLQLTAFHLVYIVLGAISTPVETLSITTFYFAMLFFLTVFTAIFLKATDNNNQLNRRNFILKCLLPFIAGCFFIGWSIPFIMFFLTYITMVQSNHDNQGFVIVLGSILPSVIVSAGGWVGTKLIDSVTAPAPE